DFAGAHLEVDVVQRHDAGVRLGDAPHLEEGGGFRSSHCLEEPLRPISCRLLFGSTCTLEPTPRTREGGAGRRALTGSSRPGSLLMPQKRVPGGASARIQRTIA